MLKKTIILLIVTLQFNCNKKFTFLDEIKPTNIKAKQNDSPNSTNSSNREI